MSGAGGFRSGLDGGAATADETDARASNPPIRIGRRTGLRIRSARRSMTGYLQETWARGDGRSGAGWQHVQEVDRADGLLLERVWCGQDLEHQRPFRVLDDVEAVGHARSQEPGEVRRLCLRLPLPEPPVRTGGVVVRVNDQPDGTEAIHRELLGGVNREPVQLLEVGDNGIGAGGDLIAPGGTIAGIQEPLRVLDRHEL